VSFKPKSTAEACKRLAPAQRNSTHAIAARCAYSSRRTAARPLGTAELGEHGGVQLRALGIQRDTELLVL
jgi:hypothetical protein